MKAEVEAEARRHLALAATVAMPHRPLRHPPVEGAQAPEEVVVPASVDKLEQAVPTVSSTSCCYRNQGIK
jgi:hypothetical protein